MKTLKENEAIIETGFNQIQIIFEKIGISLKEIRDNRLYTKGEYGSGIGWKTYLKIRWNMSEAKASRLISASDFTAELRLTGIPENELPKNERQARVLRIVSIESPDAKIHRISRYYVNLCLAENLTLNEMLGIVRNVYKANVKKVA